MDMDRDVHMEEEVLTLEARQKERERRTFGLIKWLSAEGYFNANLSNDVKAQDTVWKLFSEEFQRAENFGAHQVELKLCPLRGLLNRILIRSAEAGSVAGVEMELYDLIHQLNTRLREIEAGLTV